MFVVNDLETSLDKRYTMFFFQEIKVPEISNFPVYYFSGILVLCVL